MELDLQRLFGLHVYRTAVLIGRDPATPPLSPHLGSNTRALLVSQERRHLFVTPWCEYTLICSFMMYRVIVQAQDADRMNLENDLFMLKKQQIVQIELAEAAREQKGISPESGDRLPLPAPACVGRYVCLANFSL